MRVRSGWSETARWRSSGSRSSSTSAARCTGSSALAGNLPFDFNCGFVGYFGYELKADCDGDPAHASPTPDAAFIFADRLIAFDHLERCTYVLCATEPDGVEEAERWIAKTSQRLASLPPLADPGWSKTDAECEPLAFHLGRSRGQYLEDIATCKRRLFAGETYEVCLTNKIVVDVAPEPLPLYRALRRVNPAPFSAFLRFGDTAVLSSSPERFLSVGRDRWAEARPIKGTSRRGDDTGRGRAPGRGAASRREEPCREPDDRGPAPQRSRHRL